MSSRKKALDKLFPPVPEHYDEKYIYWDDLLRDYKKIYKKVDSSKVERVYIVMGNGTPFVIGHSWILSRHIHDDGIMNIPSLDKFNPEQDLKAAPSGYRTWTALGEIYTIAYKEYMEKIVRSSIAEKDQLNVKELVDIEERLSAIVRAYSGEIRG